MDLPKDLQLDLIGRYSDTLPAVAATPEVPSYFTFDARLGWQVKSFEISVVGQNLFQRPTHGSWHVKNTAKHLRQDQHVDSRKHLSGKWSKQLNGLAGVWFILPAHVAGVRFRSTGAISYFGGVPR